MKNSQGLTLVEVMIATLIFSMVTLAAYALIFRAQATHAQLDDSVTHQRNVRFALDRVTDTLRSAGANVNPSSDPQVADETIEGAWESALFVRGDFDGMREPALEGEGLRRIVTTANDEIVGFMLGRSGPLDHAIVLHADFSGPSGRRDAVLDDGVLTGEESRTIRLPAVLGSEQTDPPYQLIRASFNAAGELVREVIAENIFQLRFHYYDDEGMPIDVSTLAGDDTARLARASIAEVEVEIVGMSEKPQPGYSDEGGWSPDPPAARGHRKFRLSSRVALTSRLARGRDHGPLPSSGLPAPVAVTACHGHCARIVVTWPAAPGASAYQVRVNATGIDSTHDVIGSTTFIYATPDPELSYSFAVRTWDTTWGTYSGFSPAATITPSHQLPSNTPAAVPASPLVTPVVSENALELTWDRVHENASPLPAGTCITSDGDSADAFPPFDVRLLDLATYEIHRARPAAGGGFAPSEETRVDIREGNASPLTSRAFTDRTAAPCQPWYYRVRAVDACGVAGAPSPPMSAPIEFDIPYGVVPAAPDDLSSSPPIEEIVMGGAPLYRVNLHWPEVEWTAAGEPVSVSHYVIERSRRLEDAGEFSYDGRIDAFDTNRAVDLVPRFVAGKAAFYRYVAYAQFDCVASGLRMSDPSPSLEVPLP